MHLCYQSDKRRKPMVEIKKEQGSISEHPPADVPQPLNKAQPALLAELPSNSSASIAGITPCSPCHPRSITDEEREGQESLGSQACSTCTGRMYLDLARVGMPRDFGVVFAAALDVSDAEVHQHLLDRLQTRTRCKKREEKKRKQEWRKGRVGVAMALLLYE